MCHFGPSCTGDLEIRRTTKFDSRFDLQRAIKPIL